MRKAAKHNPSTAPKHFEATLERMRSRLNWMIIHLPFDASSCWGLRGQIRVKGEINGFAFRSSLFPTREDGHILLVNKKMQKEARTSEGKVARFRLEVDTEKRDISIPSELARLLREDLSLLRWHDRLNPSTRNDIAKWITEPQSKEARVRRAEQIAERLLNVMDAERELPPIFRLAFARNPQARAGWDRMSTARRRGHLFGVFYYRTPDAQSKRIGKMLDDATVIAERAARNT